MAMHGDNLITRLGVDELTTPFRQVSAICAEGLELHPVDKFYYSEMQVPGYEFLMLVDGEEAGKFIVRIESDFEKVREVGNVGIEASRKFYGHDLAFRATKALLPFFCEHGINSILITCDAGKRAIRGACDQLSARYLDTIETSVPGGQRDRFILNL